MFLSTGPKRYSDIIKSVDIYTGHLYYHLNAVQVMIKKTDGLYELNDLGLTSVELLRRLEKSVKSVKSVFELKTEKEVFLY
jgi:predicted transcriptional regulator